MLGFFSHDILSFSFPFVTHEMTHYQDNNTPYAPPPPYNALPPGPPPEQQPYYPPPSSPPPPPQQAQQAQPLYPQVPPVFSYGTVSAPSPSVLPGVQHLKGDSQVVMCPECHQAVETITYHHNGSAVVLSALALFVFGCHSGGCLIPFCCPLCKDVQHVCPNCDTTIATYSRLEQTALPGDRS